MTDGKVVRSPLLNQVLGSDTTEFAVHEFHSPGAPNALPRGGIPLHRHRTEDEAWYILAGALAFRFGAEEFTAPAGSGVLLPHGTPHTFWNPGTGPVRYLLIVRPKTEALLRVLHAPSRPGGPALKDVYARYDADLME